MSKIKIRWLWIVVGIEILAIAGLLIWALAVRQPEPHPARNAGTPPKTTPQKTYKTPKIKLVKMVDGLFKPTAITAMPVASDGRLFVIEQTGVVRIITAEKRIAGTPFLDIKNKVLSGGEMGLLGLAFHPKVADNNFFYVNYIDKNQNTIVARYTISEDTGRADAGSEKILLKIKQPFANHNGGAIAFGPDGYLYIGMGDGGSAGDPDNRAQNTGDLLGKMLRIDINKGNPYTIPPGNPYDVAGNPYARPGGKPEIWSSGLRNPWPFSFDRKTGDIFIADVGQGDWEEINLQPDKKTGVNYGWRCFEGTHKYNTAGCQNAGNYTKPIIEYDHSGGRCSVTGGYVYRGSKFPALSGKYFYCDYCSGQIYYAELRSGKWAITEAVDTEHYLSTFGENSAGELYLASYRDGAIYQIIDTANP